LERLHEHRSLSDQVVHSRLMRGGALRIHLIGAASDTQGLITAASQSFSSSTSRRICEDMRCHDWNAHSREIDEIVLVHVPAHHCRRIVETRQGGCMIDPGAGLAEAVELIPRCPKHGAAKLIGFGVKELAKAFRASGVSSSRFVLGVDAPV